MADKINGDHIVMQLFRKTNLTKWRNIDYI